MAIGYTKTLTNVEVEDLDFDPATQTELNTHEADTTSVHGIADTAKVAKGSESNLHIIRGSIDSAGAGSILTGTGFTIVRNGIDDVTVNITSAFSDTPSVVVGAGSTAIRRAKLTTSEPVVGSFRAMVSDTALGTAADGIFHFIAIGPKS